MIGADSVPLINFTSERLAFGPCGPEHIPLSLKWANDWQVSAGRGMPLCGRHACFRYECF